MPRQEFVCRLVEIMEAQQQAEAANEIRAVANNGGRRHKQVISGLPVVSIAGACADIIRFSCS